LCASAHPFAWTLESFRQRWCGSTPLDTRPPSRGHRGARMRRSIHTVGSQDRHPSPLANIALGANKSNMVMIKCDWRGREQLRATHQWFGTIFSHVLDLFDHAF